MNPSNSTGCGLNDRQSHCVSGHFSSDTWRCGVDPHNIFSQNGALIATSSFASLFFGFMSLFILCAMSEKGKAKAKKHNYSTNNGIKDERGFRTLALTCGFIFSNIMFITALTAGGSCPGWITDDWNRIVNYCRNKPTNAGVSSNNSICCYGKAIVEHQEKAKIDKIGTIILTLVCSIAIGILLIDTCRDLNKISDEEAQSLVVQTDLPVTEIDSPIGPKIKKLAMSTLAFLAFGCSVATFSISKPDCPGWVLDSWENCKNS